MGSPSELTDMELVDELCEIEEGLSDWEVEFVDSIAKALRRYGSLTPPQRVKAEQVYAEVDRG